jgi:hypothetical protein
VVEEEFIDQKKNREEGEGARAAHLRGEGVSTGVRSPEGSRR